MTTDQRTEPVVRITEACVHYGTTVALAPTSFELAPGSSVALVGANGSGKTTVLSLVAGLVDAADGSVEVVGTLSMVTQHRDHHRWMPLSVDEVLRMGRYPRRGLLGRLGADDLASIDRAAERLEVTHLRSRSFGDLSGGQQQRVLVARALAGDPDILLLDEPITGLDLPSQLRILEVIERFAEHGGIVVFSTHHLAEARRADRVMLMAGCVLADGMPSEVLVPGLLAETFGGRLIRDDGTSIVVDDHGHHGGTHATELVPHHGIHPHDHDHDHAPDHHPDRAPDHGGRG
ncbi:MAG: metal ABC transporter ATP-binding protein [Ilumatobacteraceae bacterium]